ncbi:hypothetical protein ASPWEDRAFT_40524 [Aspergillus wentii DTO 134E9]|uniref:FAD/NAD(P)-binding domain-containing protein n=1 Tax=Aspergillus wentii DTO 134E9 TaxID=1073089 RepID=A0A1L9RKE8_ASPWE|nr:uncharacterized protein ASPWEDRAFT_40524 [Aspergillus wentii DTO 134E9]OJJ35317.1 hypothetical protein ASPWEDRAFT_40524 [Aspergillus wentii DTO 134E9]
MPNPKKVAIIGAGPAGLVTAKTLLCNYPDGTFAPTIFEKRNEIGGLWPTSRTASQDPNPMPFGSKKNSSETGPVNPLMRTNLSRFSVGFSDLAWESVIGGSELPMFPQAWQVGRYLEAYAERYIPKGVIRLGHKVVQTVRDVNATADARWTVHWVKESVDEGNPIKDQDQKVVTEHFDFLIVASGFFSCPHIPDIPGLSGFEDRIVHSSSLHKTGTLNHLFRGYDNTRGKVVVIGGSMSGAEAASALALHHSSLKLAGSNQSWQEYEVHHVCTRPFRTIPTYLPHVSGDMSQENVSFQPLDIVMYDLARRPPGPIEYAFGPVSSEQVTRVNSYFQSLLGSDYEKVGKVESISNESESDGRPPWVAIGNDHAEFVRSGAISTTIGRVCAVHQQKSGLARLHVRLPNGQETELDNVAAIVMATGFMPFGSLFYLPKDVLSVLEYSATDPFFPLILDGKGSMHTEIPDLGFVGFYRAPYWGVIEMQARNLAERWAREDIHLSQTELAQRAEERQKMRHLRSADPYLHRGQFPMADYTGLVESFARDLGINHIPLRDTDERHGPVVPARYPFNKSSSFTSGEAEMDLTLGSLRTILSDPDAISVAAAMAIFRALHGTWRFVQTTKTPKHEKNISGNAKFSPQYPSDPAYEKEYIYEEVVHEPQGVQETRSRSIVRFADTTTGPDHSHILIWSVGVCEDTNPTTRFSHGLNLAPALRHVENGEPVLGEYVIHASSHPGHRYDYEFNFRGVSIVSWQCTKKTNESDEACFVRTVYER